jgi:hypothetical protein
MKARSAARLAGILLGLTAAALGVASWLDLRTESRWDPLVFAPAFLAFTVVGALIVSRRSGNAMGWFFLMMGPLGALGLAAGEYAAHVPAGSDQLPGAQWAAWVFTMSIEAALPFLLLLVMLFPHGRPLSGGWRAIAWLAVVNGIAGTVATGIADVNLTRNFPDLSHPLPLLSRSVVEPVYFVYQLGGIVLLILAGSAVIVRFRRSTGEERQQLKWFAFAAGATATAFAIFAFEPLGIEAVAAFVLFAPLLPVASGIAILRHGLYDIDRIINRTLVYGLLTLLLGAVYVGIVVGLGTFVGQSALVVAASTLLVAALFRPARRKVQSLIDRRFYRQRYDSARTLEAFTARLREEVDLDSLTEDLVGVVRETMHPAHTSLWRRTPEGLR